MEFSGAYETQLSGSQGNPSAATRLTKFGWEPHPSCRTFSPPTLPAAIARRCFRDGATRAPLRVCWTTSLSIQWTVPLIHCRTRNEKLSTNDLQKVWSEQLR